MRRRNFWMRSFGQTCGSSLIACWLVIVIFQGGVQPDYAAQWAQYYRSQVQQGQNWIRSSALNTVNHCNDLLGYGTRGWDDWDLCARQGGDTSGEFLKVVTFPPGPACSTWSCILPTAITSNILLNSFTFCLTDNFCPPTPQEQERGSSSRGGFERPRTPPRFNTFVRKIKF